MEKITKSSDKVLIDPNEPLILPDGTALVGRVEWFLYALCCLDYQNLPTPMSRIEEFANALITGEVPNIEPQSRAEQFFLAILDGNISDLPQPQSRSEVLLDKLARGEFDLSDVEPIQSRYELLLAYLIKNGGIGNIDYVLYEFSEAMKTMYNTVEKPFKSLELSGNTLVNCVLEDTENDDYTSFDKDYSGTSFAINGTSEGAIKSAILKGQTLVNLYENIQKTTSSVATYNDEWITIKANGGYARYFHSKSDMLKPSTKYLIIVDVKENTLQGSNSLQINDYGITETVFNTTMSVSGSGIFKLVSTTKDDLTNKTIDLRCLLSSSNTSGLITFRVMFIEYQDGMENWDIPYFEGMQSVKMPVIKTTGKNLFDVSKATYGYITSDGSINNAKNNVKSDFILVKGNTSYSVNAVDSAVIKSYFSWFDNNKIFISRTFGQTQISPSNAKYLIVHNNYFPTSVDTNDLTTVKLMITEGYILENYEPYKSNILSTPEEVALKGIGDVKDTLNCNTGEMVERLTEFTLTGNENLLLSSWTNNLTNCIRVDLGNGIVGGTDNNLVICNQFKTEVANQQKDYEYVSTNSSGNVSFNILRSKLETENVNGVKKYFKKLYDGGTPVMFIGKAKQEVIKTVDLNVVDQNNTKIDKMHVFNETTHVNASSDELTPTVNIGKSVSYPTIIKPNTKYTVDLKRNDKPLTVNLGGTEVTFTDGETRKTITTPSTLTNDKLSYYGIGAKCNEIMLIEGEIERNIDYFTGMQSVVMQNQMPILSTVGKNLFDGKWEIGGIGNNNGLEAGGTSNVRSVNYINVEPNTTYKASSSQLQHANVVVWYAYDKDKNFISSSTTSNIFTTPSNCKFIRVRTFDSDSTNMSLDCVLQIEQGSIATSYEPYKSSILSCNDDVTLRGIGDVQDTLDCLSGEVVKNTEKFVLDGTQSNIVKSSAYSNESYSTFSFNDFIPIIGDVRNIDILCDKLPNIKEIGSQVPNQEGISYISNGYGIRISILNSRLETTDINGLNKYLSKNPISFVCPIVEKSIKTVDLNVVDQDGNTIPKIKSYNGVTHLEVTVPKQSLLPNVSAEVATDNSKDMSSLTTKHQEISEAQSTIEDNIQSQSDEIDTALMATTEIFESILE